MDLVIECKSKGVNRKRTCELLQIDERRVRNWFVVIRLLIQSQVQPMRPMHYCHRSVLLSSDLQKMKITSTIRIGSLQPNALTLVVLP